MGKFFVWILPWFIPGDVTFWLITFVLVGSIAVFGPPLDPGELDVPALIPESVTDWEANEAPLSVVW